MNEPRDMTKNQCYELGATFTVTAVDPKLISKSRWRPMSEAPKETDVLLLWDEGEMATAIFLCEYDDKPGWYAGCGPVVNAIAWQPLPDPPTDEEMEALKNG